MSVWENASSASRLRFGRRGAGSPAQPLVRRSRPQADALAPAVLVASGAGGWWLAVVLGSAPLGAVAALLGVAGLALVVAGEASRVGRSRARRTGFALGLVLLAVIAWAALAPDAAPFAARAFGAEVLGVPVTWVFAVANLVLLGPPMMMISSSGIALHHAAAGYEEGVPAPALRRGVLDSLFDEVRILSWILGVGSPPASAGPDVARARAAGAWLVAVSAGWIAYGARRGI